MGSLMPQLDYPLWNFQLTSDLKHGSLLCMSYIGKVVQESHYRGRVHQAQVVFAIHR